jgi:F-type H+-transporting ATPase subunit alpha
VGGSAQTKAMKGVAGRLRLDLAQYRELEAFAAFASDLDQATRRQLDRGARTVEILKQPQYSPLSVAEQVMVIYAVTNGYLDTVPVSRVREWERGFLDYSRAQYPQVGDSITKTKALGKDVEPDLKRAIEAYTQLFGAGK